MPFNRSSKPTSVNVRRLSLDEVLQTDTLRMQGLCMIQRAQIHVDAQREKEQRRKIMDSFGEALK